MKVAIVGSRDYADLERVRAYVKALPADTVVISGGARGVDRVAAETARLRGLQVVEYLADWNKYGKSAGYIRNADIINAADIVFAFWDGVSKGTKHSIDLAQKAGKLAEIVLC